MARQEQENVVAMPEVPLGYRQLGTQVAGHRFDASNAAAVGLLQDAGEGRVFKPMGKPECGVREINFYESLSAALIATSTGALDPSTGNELNDRGDEGTSSSLLAELAAHVPRYYGQLKLVVNQREHTFLKLEDLTHGMAKPCIMDIKIGRRTWDPLSSPQKRSFEEAKYVICKQNLGLCLPGFQVYRPAEGQPGRTILIRHGRDYGKSLNIDGFKQALALFFNISCKENDFYGQDMLLREILRQLRSIRSWFKRQRLFHFFASSLLICYDFEQLLRLGKSLHNGFQKDPSVPLASSSTAQWIRVRCIDFAHIFPAEDSEPDHNYMFGLQSLIDIVEAMLKR